MAEELDLVEHTDKEKALIKLDDLQKKRAAFLGAKKALDKKREEEQAAAKKQAKLNQIEEEFAGIFIKLCEKLLKISINELKRFTSPKEMQVLDDQLAAKLWLRTRLQAIVGCVVSASWAPLSYRYLVKYRKPLKEFFGEDYFPFEAIKKKLDSFEDNDNAKLCQAAEKGDLEMAKLLLEYGADVNTKVAIKDVENFWNTPLSFAAGQGHLGMAELLLGQGADINSGNGFPLRRAAFSNQLEMAKFLLKKGADVHVYRDRPLVNAATYGHLEMIKLLLENNANITNEALVNAVRENQLKVVKLFLEYGADIHVYDDLAFRWAASLGHLEITELLLENNANVHAVKGEAPRLAKENKHPKVVALIEEHIKNLEAQKAST